MIHFPHYLGICVLASMVVDIQTQGTCICMYTVLCIFPPIFPASGTRMRWAIQCRGESASYHLQRWMLKMKIMGLHLIRGKYTYAEEQGYVKSQAEL